MTTQNTIKIINENTAQVTKTFEKRAKIYGTEEYKLWRKFLSENPNFTIVTKKIKKNSDKETNKNLTYKNMVIYIKEQENADELLKEFEKQKRLSKVQKSPYKYVLEWFKQTFENYDSYQDFTNKLKKDNSDKPIEVNFKNKNAVNE